MFKKTIILCWFALSELLNAIVRRCYAVNLMAVGDIIGKVGARVAEKYYALLRRYSYVEVCHTSLEGGYRVIALQHHRNAGCFNYLLDLGLVYDHPKDAPWEYLLEHPDLWQRLLFPRLNPALVSACTLLPVFPGGQAVFSEN